uniref:Uncharacterized protein n=1 Tax=Heterosigma akashiwo TaxID=2829 RepID=A0A7S4DBT5_HETAK
MKKIQFSFYIPSVCSQNKQHKYIPPNKIINLKLYKRAFVKRRISELKTLDKAPSLVSDFQLGVTSVLGALGTAVVSLAPKGPGLPDPGLLAAGLQAVLQNLAAAAPAPPMGGSFGGPAAAAAEESSIAGEGPVFDGAPEEDPLAKKVDTTAARKQMKDT